MSRGRRAWRGTRTPRRRTGRAAAAAAPPRPDRPCPCGSRPAWSRRRRRTVRTTGSRQRLHGAQDLGQQLAIGAGRNPHDRTTERDLDGPAGVAEADSASAAAATTGTNASSSAGSTRRPWRAWWRQANSCCGRRSCRRATSEITTPGARLSATIRAFASALHRLRPSAPVITSSRRTSRTSGSTLRSNADMKRSPTQDRHSRRSGRAWAGAAATALTAIERVWLYLRERCLCHRLWPAHDDILDACCIAWNALLTETGRIRSLCDFDWATVRS